MLSIENSLVLVIDIQEKLVEALDKDIIVSKSSKILSAANVLGIPVVITEQYPKGLGNTVETHIGNGFPSQNKKRTAE